MDSNVSHDTSPHVSIAVSMPRRLHSSRRDLTNTGWRSGSPPERDTPPLEFLKYGLSSRISSIRSPASASRFQRSPSKKDSGLQHHRHLKLQLDKKTDVLMPGPS